MVTKQAVVVNFLRRRDNRILADVVIPCDQKDCRAQVSLIREYFETGSDENLTPVIQTIPYYERTTGRCPVCSAKRVLSPAEKEKALAVFKAHVDNLKKGEFFVRRI